MRASASPDHYVLYQLVSDPEEFEWDYLVEGAFTGSSWDKWLPYAVAKVDGAMDLAKVNTLESGEGRDSTGH